MPISKVVGVRIIGALLACGAVIGVSSCCSTGPAKAGETAALRQRTLLDSDWRFHRGEVASSNAVIAANFDDKSWQGVQVPHDYVLDGTFDQTNARNHGYLVYDVGWYRKQFVVPESDKDKLLRLDFDGVFRDSDVWLNGQYLGHHLSGYTPFSYDVTKIAKVGGENVLTVRVDPREFEGWWYEGGGIYRHVYLTALSPVHVAQWGTFVTSTVSNNDQGMAVEAGVTIQTTIDNKTSLSARCEVVSEILGPKGTVLKTLKADETVSAGDQHEVTQQTTIQDPQLWSIESPHLCQLRTTILQDGKPVDATTTPFGIRTIRFDADKGFFLNGKHVEIQGTANHQDFAGVGIAVPDSLQEWRVKQLKASGCNAWRTAHNPPSEALLEACDRLGMVVMAENRHLGDSYNHHSPHGTEGTNLMDLATMIRRDRNHPSIIMWSMCNEEGLQGKQEGADLITEMMKVVHRYDTTRPITSAMNAGWNTNGIASVEEIIGVNYSTKNYDQIHKNHPEKMMFGSEDTNEKTTRGEYEDVAATGMRSGYNMSDKEWLTVFNRPFMAGSFTWTGFDYKGEPNPYGWPDISNNTGLLDVCGFPKDKFYYFLSCWSDVPMVHLMPSSWNWPGKEGKNIRVVAFSNAREVEVFLNGQSFGKKAMPRDGHLEWQVPYQAGKLEAKAYTDGKMVATDVVETTGAPARIQLSPWTTTLHANSEDAVVVPVSILDAQGRIVPDSTNRISFQLTGDGRILGVGNGNPADHDIDHATERTVFHGHCIAVVEAGMKPGTLTLRATSSGLPPATVTFEVRPGGKAAEVGYAK